MKSVFYVLVICVVFCLETQSKPITREQAQQRAEAFMKLRKDSKRLAPVVKASRLAPKRKALAAAWTEAPYYVFDRGTNEGFVIVSGDDQTIDVLGYCVEGSFDYEQMPPNMKEWLDDYADQITRIQAGAPVVSAAIPTHAAVAPMMKSKWSQGNPYNLTCPYDNGSRSVTGCVATAMAQLLYYNRDKSVTETQATIPAFDTWTKGIHVDAIPAGSPIDWDNMRDTYGSANDLQKKAVANLMLYCGAGAKMDYTSSSSGAQSYDAYQAFIKYFGYSASKLKWYDYTNVSSDEEWDRIIYTEMAEGRPIYISGSNATAGHAFIAHGYDGNKRYYINWGWGGQSDGYYYLTNLTPGDGQGIGGSDDGYNGYRQIFVGIEPDNFSAKVMTFADATVKQICLENWDADHDGKFTYGEAAAVTDMGTVFQGKAIKTFSECYYFTGLTSLADDAFLNCEKLTTIRLPKGLKTIGSRTFKGCALLKKLDFPASMKTVGEEAFSGCKVLTGIELPSELSAIEKETFYGCMAIKAMSLPVCIERIGEKSFGDCTSLKEITVNTFHPENIQMGTAVFANVNLSDATLNVLQGTKSYFAAADQWKDFGNMFEMRERSAGAFVAMEAGQTYYLYNVGTGRYLTKGEAWGYQAVVGSEPMRFTVNHGSTMPQGVYYLTSTDLGKKTFLFRTSTDKNVGEGVQAAFVDGTNLTANAYWTVQEVSDKVYTFQIPSNGTNYAAGMFWGVQTDHQSGAATPTYGVYSDVTYADHQQNCHWQFVRYDAAAEEKYEQGEVLQNLINIAEGKKEDATAEKQVYDNLESTIEQIMKAQKSLRLKLGFISFADPAARRACLGLFDSDRNGEIGYTEASDTKDLGELSFMNNIDLVSFDELQYFKNVPTIYGNTFYQCKNLESVVLPSSVERIYYRAFTGCSKLTKITLPEFLTQIGDNCFSNCTSLKEVFVKNPDPSVISLGSNVFSGVTLSACTLYVPVGSKALYEAAPVWKNFGTIVEVRMHAYPDLSDFTVGKAGYIYHLGTRKMIGMGEAYGTQSVVAREGRLYQLKRTTSMPDDVYYLYDHSTGQVVFRTNTDQKVGEGVSACFGDGALSEKAYWKVTFVDDKTFTLQVPENDAAYVSGKYLGVNESHESDFASPTAGLYWDISGVSAATTWAFIAKENVEAARVSNALIEQLSYLLDRARSKGVDCADEQAVYTQFDSTDEQLRVAIHSLYEKMRIIQFSDDKVKTICLANWDADGDDELSYEEAAAVQAIGELFRKQGITAFEELKYFTSLTEIPENAFSENSSLKRIILPAGVSAIGMNAFQSCTNLQYLAMLNETAVIPMSTNGINARVTVFVVPNMLEAYQADADWTLKTAMIVPYTGTPVVTVEGNREYGRTTSSYKVVVSGAPVDGVPTYQCEQAGDVKVAAGDYPIVVEPGTITTIGLICQEGVFTVKQKKATLTARSYTREEGQPNPVFELEKCVGLRNNDQLSEIFLQEPVFTCEATIDSPVGEYDIVPSGAMAQNYYFEYTNGKLTITAASGVEAVRNVQQQDEKTLYDLQGRRVLTPKRGMYVERSTKRKIIVRP